MRSESLLQEQRKCSSRRGSARSSEVILDGNRPGSWGRMGIRIQPKRGQVFGLDDCKGVDRTRSGREVCCVESCSAQQGSALRIVIMGCFLCSVKVLPTLLSPSLFVAQALLREGPSWALPVSHKLVCQAYFSVDRHQRLTQKAPLIL